MRITIDIGPSPSPSLKPDELHNLLLVAADIFRTLFPPRIDPMPPMDFGGKEPDADGCVCFAGDLARMGVKLAHRPHCPARKSDEETPGPNPPTSGAV